MKIKVFLVSILLLQIIPVYAAKVAGIEKTDTKELIVRQKTFDIVWSTINEQFYDSAFGGIDWAKMKEIYLPKAISAASDDDFHLVLNQMINELNRSHLSIFSKNQIAKNNLCREGNIGLKIKIIENQPIIFQVENNSSTAKSGLKQGFVINQIDDEFVSEIFQKAELSRKRSLETNISRRLCGKPNSIVKVIALNENGQPQTFQVVRRTSNELTTKLGSAKKELMFASKKIENNIGYIAFSNWDLQLQTKIEEAIRNFLETKGIIIDLRGNLGGNKMLSTNLAGYFFAEKVSFGTFKRRSGQSEEIIDPQNAQFIDSGKGKYSFGAVKYNYKGKIVILADYASASTSELFAAGLQENGRAKIIGEKTFGGVLSAIIQTLPTGGLFSFPAAEYKTTKGTVLEGRGVEPDISVALTRQSLLAGRDLQLESAIKELSK